MKIPNLLKKQPKFSMIKNCPFCGGIPKLSRCGDQRNLWYVRCTQCCETPIDWGEAKVNPDDAVKIYNRRADFAEHIIKIHNRIRRLDVEEKEDEI